MVAPFYGRRSKLRDRRIQRDALRVWWTALAKRESAPVDIVCIGDSLTEGARVSDIEKRWVARLRDKLRARYPVSGVTGGQGYVCANYYIIGDAGTPQANQVMTQTGGSTDPSYLFGLGRRYRKLAAAGDKVAVTVTCSSVEAVYTRGTGRGVLGLAIDGGSVATVSTSGGIQSASRFSSGPLTPGSHGVEISWQSGGEVDVEGLMVYHGDEAAGIRLWEAGHGGVKTDFYNGGIWISALTSIQPALAIIELAVNDLLFDTGSDWPSSAVKGNLDALLTAINGAVTVDPSVLVVVPHLATPAISYVEPWSNYVDALWSFALAHPTQVAIVDLNDLLGSATTASGLFDADLIHLNDLGGEFYANAIANALEP